MINLQKSQPAPVCLEEEKKKASGDYKCGDVLARLASDFHNKCYLCEEKGIGTINVEHFKPHRKNTHLKFDWNNLFYACGHCNNTKLADSRFDDILNCIENNSIITNEIEFEINCFPKEKAKIIALAANATVKNTCDLLDLIYNGKTEIKKLESSNLRDKLIKEINDFNKALHEYFEEGLFDEEKDNLRRIIGRKLSPSSPFTAFKIWIIKRNPALMQELGYLLPVF